MTRHVRVLVVDDSPFYRRRIRQCLEASPEIQVIGEAGDGLQAQKMNRELAPDLITMDVVMPVMDGIEAVRRVMAERPVPVLMFSSFTSEGARATLDALEAGAVDFLPKITSANEVAATGRRLRERVLGLARGHTPDIARASAARPLRPERGWRPRLLLIGASTGGPMAVQKILAGLPADYPIPILVVIHMPGSFTPAYAERMDAQVALRVREAADGLSLRPGQALIAPGGRQTVVIDRGQGPEARVAEDSTALYRPSLDVTFSSAADLMGGDTLAVVLTGMGSDGREGARRIRAAGGRIWAQDEQTSVVYGMPQAVVRDGLAEQVLPLQEFASGLRGLV